MEKSEERTCIRYPFSPFDPLSVYTRGVGSSSRSRSSVDRQHVRRVTPGRITSRLFRDDGVKSPISYLTVAENLCFRVTRKIKIKRLRERRKTHARDNAISTRSTPVTTTRFYDTARGEISSARTSPSSGSNAELFMTHSRTADGETAATDSVLRSDVSAVSTIHVFTRENFFPKILGAV